MLLRYILVLYLPVNNIIMSIQSIGESVKIRRKSLGITQPSLASLSGVSTNTLYRIEKGLANPSIDTLQKIANILGLEVGLKVKSIETFNS